MYHATLTILGKIENMQVLFLSVLLPLISEGQPGGDLKFSYLYFKSKMEVLRENTGPSHWNAGA